MASLPANPEPPLRACVLVEGKPGTWRLLYANGDIAEVRARALDWAESHPGRRAVVMAYDDDCTSSLTTKWSKR